jgi:hypothetical protein
MLAPAASGRIDHALHPRITRTRDVDNHAADFVMLVCVDRREESIRDLHD